MDMNVNKRARISYKALTSLAGVAALISLSSATGNADPVTTAGYSLSVFAAGSPAYQHPDSIAVADNSVFVVYTNNVAPDGSDGKSSTLVKYSMSGAVEGMTSSLGSTDGLKYDAATGMLWATHNEDGNAFVTLFNPNTLAQTKAYSFSSAAHGGGYDDLAFLNGKTYVAASNPSLNAAGKVNGAPSIASVQLTNTQAAVTGVLANNAMAMNVATGKMFQTNQTDPDSMTTSPTGGLVLDSQGDGLLLYVNKVGTSSQSVNALFLVDSQGKSVMVDDTVFPTSTAGYVLVADPTNDTVYKVSSGEFALNGAYSGGNGDSFGVINQSTGLYTPLITGMSGASGEAFVANAPEPSTLTLAGIFLAAFGLFRMRKSLPRKR